MSSIKSQETDSFYCKLCNIQFQYKSIYDKHLKTKGHVSKLKDETDEVEWYKCLVCDCKFPYISNLNVHLKTKKHLTNLNSLNIKNAKEEGIKIDTVEVNGDEFFQIYVKKDKKKTLKEHIETILADLDD